jgi:hypothetical protein
MIWDSELETLAMQVADLFGDDALCDAMMRALHVAHQLSVPSGGRLIVFEAGAVEHALRNELRRLLVAH